jgi:hypothetical protein
MGAVPDGAGANGAPMSSLLKPKAAAEGLGMSLDTFRAHLKAGQIKSIIIGMGQKRKHRLFR